MENISTALRTAAKTALRARIAGLRRMRPQVAPSTYKDYAMLDMSAKSPLSLQDQGK